MIFSYIRGCVYLRAENISPERLLALCRKNGIRAWDIRPEEAQTFLCVSPADWERLKPVLEKAGGRAQTRITGLGTFLARAEKRTVLLIGLPLVLLCLCVSGLFLWDIRIEGCDRVDPVQVRDALRDCGVGIGTFSMGIKEKQLQNDLLLRLPEVQWIAVNLKGCVARVQTVEKAAPSPEVPAGANIVAAADGVLSSLEVFSGTAAVNKGDAVKKGQVLVWGYEGTADNRVPPRAYIRGRERVVLSGQTGKTEERILESRDTQGGTWGILGKKAGKIVHTGSNLPQRYVTIVKEENSSFFLSFQTEYRRSFVTLPREKTGEEARNELYACLHTRMAEMGEILWESEAFFQTEKSYGMTLTCDIYGDPGRIETGD